MAKKRTAAMPKKTTPHMAKNDTEALLAEVLRRIDPAELRLMVPRFAFVRERAAFELTATTRDCTISWDGKTIAAAAREALEYLETPDPDPFQPAWRRCSRMARHVVRNVLLQHAARHRELAASAKVAGTQSSAADFEIADAFFAAISELDHEDIDDDGALLQDEPLAAPRTTEEALSALAAIKV